MLQAILFAPLLGAILTGFFYKQLGEKLVITISVVLLFINTLFSWLVFFELDHTQVKEIVFFTWIKSGELKIQWGIRLDSLTAIMLVVINTISAFVHLYSIGYMSNDPNWGIKEVYRARFFSYLSLFPFAMLELVTSNNLVQLVFRWEGVGLASYLLIGFYYKKQSANAAAVKAFIVKRVGDVGLALAVFSTFLLVGSLNFSELFAAAPRLSELQMEFWVFELSSI